GREDGGGRGTGLERLVPAHFALATPMELAEALHVGRIDRRRLVELARVVVDAATDDAVAAAIVERLAHEIVTLARVALERLGLLGEHVEVVLGGGVLAAGNPVLLDAVASGLRALSAALEPPPGEREPRLAPARPIVGAAPLALDEAGADDREKIRARRELTAAAVLEALPSA